MRRGALTWISAIFLPLALLPLAWMALLAAGFCGRRCGTGETVAIDALIVACVALAVAWLMLLVAMIRGRITRGIRIMTIAADALTAVLLVASIWTFGAV